MQQRIGIYRARQQEDDDVHRRLAHREVQEVTEDGRHERCRDAKGRRRAGQQREHRQQVDDAARQAVGMLAQQRPAGFRILLAAALADMEHKAEGHSQHQIEAPRDKAPMEQGIYPCPVLNAAHLCQMGVGCIQHPFRKRVKQDIRSKTASKHHGAPCKEGILRLFVGFTQNNIPVLRTRNVQ